MPEYIAAAVRDKQRRDDIQTAELVSRGTPPVQATTGIDGGMNSTFFAAVRSRGGPGTTIRTASGTIPAHVNPPGEPTQVVPSNSVNLPLVESMLVPAPHSSVHADAN